MNNKKFGGKKIFFGMVFLILFILGFYYIPNFNLDSIVSFIGSLGVVGPLVLIVIMAAAIVISPIPSIPLTISSGIVFGGFLGGVYSLIGAGFGALFAFLISKKLGRDLMKKYLKKDLDLLDNINDNYLFFFIFIARLLPIFHFDILSYAAGLTRISSWKFMLATILGMIPATFIFSYSGEVIFTKLWVTILITILFVVFPFLFIHKIPKWLKNK